MNLVCAPVANLDRSTGSAAIRQVLQPEVLVVAHDTTHRASATGRCTASPMPIRTPPNDHVFQSLLPVLIELRPFGIGLLRRMSVIHDVVGARGVGERPVNKRTSVSTTPSRKRTWQRVPIPAGIAAGVVLLPLRPRNPRPCARIVTDALPGLSCCQPERCIPLGRRSDRLPVARDDVASDACLLILVELDLRFSFHVVSFG